LRKTILLAVLTLVLPFSLAYSVYPDTICWENNPDYPHEHSAVDMSYLNNYDINKNGIVYVQDGHFRTKQGRMNFFGTNLTFEA
jgi:hypothetical protein